MVLSNAVVLSMHGCGQGWNYNQSRPHLLTIYPTLAASYRTLIFNGDFDACVPYLHNGAAPIIFR